MRPNSVSQRLRRLSITTLVPALLASAVFSTSAAAAPVWSVIPTGGWATTLTGTLGDTSVTLTTTLASGTPAPMFSGTTDYGTYNIWDNAAAENSAHIWPATAAGEIQVVVGVNSNPSHLTAKFGRPLINPQMLVYSLDNSFIDFSSTRTVANTPAVLSVVKNSSATYDSGTQKLGTTGWVIRVPEGCPESTPIPGRGCAVVTFIGTYSQLDMVMQTTSGGDGVGIQFGVDPAIEAARMQPVPTLSQWALLLMSICLAGTAVVAIQRQRNT